MGRRARQDILLTGEVHGKTLSSLCSPVYLVQNITFFKHIFTVCTNTKSLQITTRLGKILDPLPCQPGPEVRQSLCIYICIKKSLGSQRPTGRA